MDTELTLTEKVAKLDDQDRQFFKLAMQAAIFGLATCWDALHDAENILSEAGYDTEIETDQLDLITSEIVNPAEAYGFELAVIVEYMEADCG